MANPITSVGSLTDEVGALLRHDNIDTRINTWITSTYNDIITRAPLELFQKYVKLTLPLGLEIIDISALTAEVGNPIALIYQDSTNKIFMPAYRTMADYARTAHSMGGSALSIGPVPLIWSIGPVAAEATGKSSVHVFPANAAAATLYLFYTANRETTPVASTGYLDFPYHFEHVLIWGAVAKGYKALRPAMYQIAKAEYEQALGDLYMIMGYRPDETPVFQSINGAYAGTGRLATPARYPDARRWVSQ
jgi:hypothetical protein